MTEMIFEKKDLLQVLKHGLPVIFRIRSKATKNLFSSLLPHFSGSQFVTVQLEFDAVHQRSIKALTT